MLILSLELRNDVFVIDHYWMSSCSSSLQKKNMLAFELVLKKIHKLKHNIE